MKNLDAVSTFEAEHLKSSILTEEVLKKSELATPPRGEANFFCNGALARVQVVRF